MTHYGSLGTKPVWDEIHDIRGTSVRGADNTKLGEVSDVVFDHDNMAIAYIVVDSGGWLEGDVFLLPVDHVSADRTNENGLVAEVTRQQIQNSPQYDEKVMESEHAWKKYEREFKKYWDEQPIMHMKDSYRIITPPEEPTPGQGTSTSQSNESGNRELDAARLFPERISSVFSDPAPGSGKVTLRPKSVVRTEEAAAGVALLKPRWWDAFENYLRLNKDDIQTKCPQCESKAA
jgi:hypothetical protein